MCNCSIYVMNVRRVYMRVFGCVCIQVYMHAMCTSVHVSSIINRTGTSSSRVKWTHPFLINCQTNRTSMHKIVFHLPSFLNVTSCHFTAGIIVIMIG